MAFWNGPRSERSLAYLGVPEDRRGPGWWNAFLTGLPDEVLHFEPGVLRGPNGFAYVVARRQPEPGTVPATLRARAESLTDAGHGVVIEPGENVGDWVVSLGELAAIRARGTLLSVLDLLVRPAGREFLDAPEDALVGAPTEEVLPSFLRPHLGAVLRAHGIADPHAAVVLRGSGERLLTFGELPEKVAERLGWILPPYCRHVGLDFETVREMGVPL